ncbi:MAG: glycoside hydrolase family 15 protein [Sciscionella sp.]
MVSNDSVDLQRLFPPQVLRQYALLADGERGALIGPHGDIAWMCAPRWDSDGVCSSLLGGAGLYAVTPQEVRHVWGGYYERQSLIWRSRWVTNEGAIECREALAFPGEPERAVLLRRIEACDGPARVRVYLDLRAGFGRHGTSSLVKEGGVWSGRSGPLRWRWTGGADALTRRRGPGGGELLVLDLAVPAGAHHDLVLELSEQQLPHQMVEVDTAWRATAAAWGRATPSLEASIAPRDADNAYAVLRGLTSSDGGMVGAATTSLPERAEAGRNYDYRYAWIRDQSYAGMAAAAAGGEELLDTAVGFIGARLIADGKNLRPAYTVTGEPIPGERHLDLPGYPGGGDRVGNRVNDQFQLDAFGEALQLLATAGRHDRLDSEGWRAVRAAVTAIELHWGDAGTGVWELDNRNWTHSRLTCVAGLRAVAALPGAGTDLAVCASLADAILAETARTSLHPDGHWQRSPDDEWVDAALLLPSVRGALPADDPRTVATVNVVRQRLSAEGYVYRFRHDERELGDAEGAFLLCGFMMALADHQQGRAVDAARWFERNRGACGPAGLFSEEYDITQRQLRGNLPQAFVHALMLESAVRLAEPSPDAACAQRKASAT